MPVRVHANMRRMQGGWAWLAWAAPAAAAVVKGMLGNRAQEKATEASLQMSQEQAALQREFAQHGVQWRVEDAQRAGVHPVYALGAGGASYNPINVDFRANNSYADMVGDLGDIAGQYFANEAARERQAQVSGGTGYYHQGQPNLGYDPNKPGYYDLTQGTPSQVISRSSNDPSSVAGVQPAWQPFEIQQGVLIDLFYSQEGPSESLETIMQSKVLMAMVLRRTYDKYGPVNFARVIQMIPGAAEVAGALGIGN